jgi:hypothetical protein
VGRNEGLSKLRNMDLAKTSIAIFEIAVRLRFRAFERAKSRKRILAAFTGQSPS